MTAQQGEFELGDRPAASYEVVYRPPTYPVACRPFSCPHEPQYALSARTRSVDHKLVTEHVVCLACGASQPCTFGGNVLVDLHMLWQRHGWHAEIGARILELRDRWARVAARLFDESGWIGKHEKIARLIDPHLTMRLTLDQSDALSRMTFGAIRVDPTYLRPAAEESPHA